jgi:hypothetical protein
MTRVLARRAGLVTIVLFALKGAVWLAIAVAGLFAVI